MTGSEMSAAALKAEGNELFAKQEWESAIECYSEALEVVEESDIVSKTALLSNRSACFIKLLRFEKALADGNLCIKLRPEWSKGYARCGEAYSRQQNFRLAGVAYSEAIRTGEDGATKSRYKNALKLVKGSQNLQEQVRFVPSAAKAFDRPYHYTWFSRFLELKKHGFEEPEGGGMRMLLHAWNSAATAWVTVDAAMIGQIGGNFHGKAGTTASQDFSECILLDHIAFAIPPNGHRDPRYTFKDKFSALNEFEFYGLGLMKYFEGRRWTAKEIISDLAEKKRNGEVWNTIRLIGATLIRGSVLMAFRKAASKKHAEAIEDLQLAIELIDEGNKVWKDVPYSEKGTSYRPTMRRMIKVESLHYRLEANQMATNDSAKVAFSLKSIETAAKTIIKENPQAKWRNADDVPSTEHHWSRLGYYVIATARANIALGYCSAQRAQVPFELLNLATKTVVVAETDHAKKAARYYDLAYQLLPNDYYGKPRVGFQALEQHLLAGGKTVREVLKLAEEIEKNRKSLLPIFVELDDEDSARTFVEERVTALHSWLKSPQAHPVNDVAPIDLVLKPIPTLMVGKNPETFDSSKFLTPAFWNSLPGDVAVVRKVQVYVSK
ncbi:hypothetical protein JCM3765_007349 [Sporobolomyces pararoseus]